MAKRSRLPAGMSDPAVARRDVVFALLADPVRRRILELLADGQPHTASTCAKAVGKRLDAALKHLVALRDAAVVASTPDPSDARRQRYTLRPETVVRTSENGQREMDFGCAVLRMENRAP
ncbi:MAG: winged helix-turn-helix transcriptional regulator [Verrucomicrobiaceae bacterium]|nr:winged helix-turn-helix transcriptional regulator [Verrucomicrobiaceae bacterium]